MPSTFNRIAAWSVDRRPYVASLIMVITLIAAWGYAHPYWSTIRGWFPEEIRSHLPEQLSSLNLGSSTDEEDDVSATTPDMLEKLPDVTPVSLSDSEAVIVVRSDALFTRTGVATMRRVVEKLESLDHVASVLWMDRVPILNIFGLPEPLLPNDKASPARFAAAQQRAFEHPLVGGQMLSEDGRTTLLLITFDWDFIRSDEDCTSVLRETAEAAAASSDASFEFLVTGQVPAWLVIVEAHEANQLRYQSIGYGMIVLMTIIMFRGIRAVFIVSLAPAAGVFWTLGILQYFELKDNPFNDVILPVLISLVALTDGVHLMVQIRKLRCAGHDEKSAARLGIQQVGLACALTSLTTAIGLGSLTLASNEWVQDFGYCCVLGVILTFVAVVTIIPLASSTWIGRRIHIGHENSLVDRNLGRIGGVVDAVLKRSRLFSALGIGTTLILFAVSLQLRPDERRSNALPENSEPRRALQHMDEALGGLEFSEVQVTWSPEVASDSPEVLEVITAVDDLLNSEELIGYPLSIRNLIDAQPGEGPAAERMSLLELLPPPLKRAFYTPERRRASVTFRVRDIGIAKFGPVFERIESGLADITEQHRAFTLELDGSAVWRWRNLYQIVVDLATSLGTACLIIFGTLALVYRSVRIGLISVIPNLFPLVVAATWLVVSGENLEIVSVCAFTVCLGIAVDDTIHFLTRFQEECRVTGDRHEAIHNAFTGVGTALIMTTVVLVAGFGTVMFSDSRDHYIFATMGCLTIASALFADLIFLPALLDRFAPALRQKDPAETDA